MSDQGSSEHVPELWANISQAAYELVVAEVEDDEPRASAAREASATAVGEAIRAGHPLTAIARHEAEGRQRATDEMGKGLLKAATTSARRRREAQAAYERDVRRAARLLPEREVALAVGVAPGTVRAILRKQPDAEANITSDVELDDATAGSGDDLGSDGS